MACVVAGCTPKTINGAYIYKQGDLSARYIFQPDGTVIYNSNLEGKIYHTKTGNGVYIIQGKQVIVSLHGMMDMTSPFNFKIAFKRNGKDLVELYTVDANGQTNADHQYRYEGLNQ